MRAFALVLALALTLFVIYCAYAMSTSLRRGRDRRSQQKAVWQVRHYGDNEMTVVAVSLTTPTAEILDEHVVARVPDADPDWQRLFLAAQQEAAERAFHLNTDS
ncbi:hypothetical protein WEI85_28660 [Actinomycetes bacterium KLBMP 9797]